MKQDGSVISLSMFPPVTVLQQSADSVTLQMRLDENLAGFAGHFPGQPVLPGVMQLHWVAQWARQYLSVITHGEMEVIKFQQLLLPGMTIALHLRVDHGKQRLYFEYRQGDNAYASGRMVVAGAAT